LTAPFAVRNADPYNHGRTHNIKKIEGVSVGEGPWRLTLREETYS
jgi:hypothetical protein